MFYIALSTAAAGFFTHTLIQRNVRNPFAWGLGAVFATLASMGLFGVAASSLIITFGGHPSSVMSMGLVFFMNAAGAVAALFWLDHLVVLFSDETIAVPPTVTYMAVPPTDLVGDLEPATVTLEG